jgi:hypothetical protein
LDKSIKFGINRRGLMNAHQVHEVSIKHHVEKLSQMQLRDDGLNVILNIQIINESISFGY